MNIGISVTSAYQTDDVRAAANWMVERAAAANAAGLDSLFVGDHHVTASPYYQNSAILGRMLAEWGDRPAGALYLLPLWNPVLLAEQVATLACITPGRFIMQCGLGAGRRTFAAMGTDTRFRPSRFEACLDALRRLWAGEQVTVEGPYDFHGAHINPLPPEPVEVWIGASADVAIERAARLGDAWLASPALLAGEARRQLDVYTEALDANGKSLAGRPVAIRRDIHVGADDDDAADTMRPVLERGYRGFDTDALLIGGPETVAEGMRALFDMGYTDVIVRSAVADQSAAIASIERLADVKSLLSGS